MTSNTASRLLAEGIVIVVSILLAFSLDALWDYRGELEDEKALLQALASEFSTNQRLLTQTIDEVQHDQALIEAFVAMSPDEAGALEPDTAWRYLNAAWKPNTYELASGVLTSALASGGLALIRDEGVRTMVAGWPGRVEDIRERAAVMIQQEASVQAGVDRVAGSQRVETLGPSSASALLEGVRADPLAMAAIARKRFQAGIYLFQLDELMVRLDSTVAAISER